MDEWKAESSSPYGKDVLLTFILYFKINQKFTQSLLQEKEGIYNNIILLKII